MIPHSAFQATLGVELGKTHTWGPASGCEQHSVGPMVAGGVDERL